MSLSNIEDHNNISYYIQLLIRPFDNAVIWNAPLLIGSGGGVGVFNTQP